MNPQKCRGRNCNKRIIYEYYCPSCVNELIKTGKLKPHPKPKENEGKIQIDRTEETRNWTNKMKEVRQNEKDVKAAIVAANNHYGGYGPGTVDIFRENMDMEKISFENIDIPKINRPLEIENRFNWNSKQKESQTTLTDFV
jgi:hypothetical protein